MAERAGLNWQRVFGGVQNLTDRRNFAGCSLDRVNNRIRFNERPGIFPLAGVEWRFWPVTRR